MLLTWLVAHALAAEPTVCFQPLGSHDVGLLRSAMRGARVLYGFPVERLPARAMPAHAWTPTRRRWRADRLLHWLDREVDARCGVVVGFTSQDISTTKEPHDDWGVFGLGQVGGRTAMVSSHRLGGGGTLAKSRERRIVKVTNHEIGHVLGIPHVFGPGCLMNDAEGSIRTVDAESGLFCTSTRLWIQQRLQVRLPLHARFPWWE